MDSRINHKTIVAKKNRLSNLFYVRQAVASATFFIRCSHDVSQRLDLCIFSCGSGRKSLILLFQVLNDLYKFLVKMLFVSEDYIKCYFITAFHIIMIHQDFDLKMWITFRRQASMKGHRCRIIPSAFKHKHSNSKQEY